MTTGEKIAILRKQRGLTQESLGEQIGVSRQAVSKWESDVTFPETDKLILLSKLFNVSVDYLLNIQNEKATNDNRKKLINFFPGIWSTSFFIITLLFYLFPFMKIENITFNAYHMLFTTEYSFGNVIMLIAFFLQIIMFGLGVSLSFMNNKKIHFIRQCCSYFEFIIWLIVLILSINEFQIGMAFLMLSSISNSMGITFIKFNNFHSCDETHNIVGENQNNRFFTLIYGIIIFFTFLILLPFEVTHGISIIDPILFGFDNAIISIILILIYLSVILVLISSIIIYLNNNKKLYIARVIITWINFGLSSVLFVYFLILGFMKVQFMEIGTVILLVISFINVLGINCIKLNKHYYDNDINSKKI